MGYGRRKGGLKSAQNDVLSQARFCNNPLVTGPPHIRFYVGAALIVGGVRIGPPSRKTALLQSSVSTRILGRTMRDAARNKEWWKGAARLPKILVLIRRRPPIRVSVCASVHSLTP